MGEPLSILKLIVQASIPVQIVIALLLLASLSSWAISLMIESGSPIAERLCGNGLAHELRQPAGTEARGIDARHAYLRLD